MKTKPHIKQKGGTVTEVTTARNVPACAATPWVILDKTAPPTAMRLSCQRCATSQDFPFPMPLASIPKTIDEFVAKHLDCKKPQSQIANQKSQIP